MRLDDLIIKACFVCMFIVVISWFIGCASTKPIEPSPDLKGQNQSLCSAGFDCIIEDGLIYKASYDSTGENTAWGVYDARD